MTQPTWHRTKIVCTLGPATDAPGVLPALVESGMDIARLNLSHGDRGDHVRRIAAVREVASSMKQPVGLLMDLPGPKFRVGTLAEGSRTLERGMRIRLADVAGDERALPVRHRRLLRGVRPGELIYLADGSIELRVLSVDASGVDCEVIAGGTVRSGSGINVPESELSGLVPTDDDRRHLAFAASQGAEWIGVSFVQSPDDLRRVRSCLPPGCRSLLMSKIEKRAALAVLDAIAEASDGLMVARGDLGVETDLAEIALVQKRIIAVANARGRPVVTATQMLESMVEQPHPTRAEVTDIANAVLDGTDGVMLSAESAIGKYPVPAVAMLRRVVAATESEHGARMMQRRLREDGEAAAGEPLGIVACQLAARLGAKAIVTEVADPAAAAALSRYRPDAPIIAVTESEPLQRALAMVWGVSPILVAQGTDIWSRVAAARDWLVAYRYAKVGDPVVVISRLDADRSAPDTLRIVRLPA
jgi:pyruvate kinase